ncbi:MAG TPA: RNA-binding protein [Polyangiaceae bacterium]|jgi:RNA recognition motif-containing protein|nr:RNA-binding protein [Polyangiaceae bacterium]
MNRRILAGNLSPATDDALLRRAFEPFGVLDYAKVVVDRLTGKSRGFGFVRFIDAKSVEPAVRQMNGAVLDGRVLTIVVSRTAAGGGE